MKLLLDTHAFLWFDSSPTNLSPHAASLIRDPTNTVLVSAASIWEIVIKIQASKLKLDRPIEEILAAQVLNGIAVLSISEAHVLATSSLPLHHRDPFDRVLIAQANVEGATLISKDRVFASYPVTTAW